MDIAWLVCHKLVISNVSGYKGWRTDAFSIRFIQAGSPLRDNGSGFICRS